MGTGGSSTLLVGKIVVLRSSAREERGGWWPESDLPAERAEGKGGAGGNQAVWWGEEIGGGDGLTNNVILAVHPGCPWVVWTAAVGCFGRGCTKKGQEKEPDGHCGCTVKKR